MYQELPVKVKEQPNEMNMDQLLSGLRRVCNPIQYYTAPKQNHGGWRDFPHIWNHPMGVLEKLGGWDESSRTPSVPQVDT